MLRPCAPLTGSGHRSAAESRLKEKEAELGATQAQFAQLLSDFKFNLKARGLRAQSGAAAALARKPCVCSRSRLFCAALRARVLSRRAARW
jgi:hypothetical protein